MVFSSIVFLFLFLPIVMALYYFVSLFAGIRNKRLGTRMGNLILLSSSLFFYAWGEQWLVFVMLGSTLIDYTCGLVIAGRRGKHDAVRKAALVVSICANLSILGFFKYFNFGVENFLYLVGMLSLDVEQWSRFIQISLPLGISFYTFQSMSYTIDVYREKTEATRNVLDFACFVTLFPQLVAGPIVRYKDIASQLVHRVVTRELFASGVGRFILGLGKKVLVANTVAVVADKIWDIPNDQLSFDVAWLGIVCYTIQIYFDFSGYSDMAIGLGRMFGFRILENFNYPYVAKTVQDFWRRWHISLSMWFRDYLYIPLGGSRISVGKTYANLVTVFFLCGLWHGASWTFVIWGLYHGSFLVFERLGFEKWISRHWAPARHVYVLLVVMCGWVIFRSETFSQALAFFNAMAGLAGGDQCMHVLDMYLRSDVLLALIFGFLFSCPIVPWVVNAYRSSLAARTGRGLLVLELGGNISRFVFLFLILFTCILSLSSGTYNPFIYFRF